MNAKYAIKTPAKSSSDLPEPGFSTSISTTGNLKVQWQCPHCSTVIKKTVKHCSHCGIQVRDDYLILLAKRQHLQALKTHEAQTLAGVQVVVRGRVTRGLRHLRPRCDVCSRGLAQTWTHCQGCTRQIIWIDPEEAPTAPPETIGNITYLPEAGPETSTAPVTYTYSREPAVTEWIAQLHRPVTIQALTVMRTEVQRAMKTHNPEEIAHGIRETILCEGVRHGTCGPYDLQRHLP